MRLKLIACEVFTREVCYATAKTPHVIDIEFTPKEAHDDSDKLRHVIQKKITETENSEINYEAILLGYGLCGNSVLGIKSLTIPLVIPRAHDCCTIFLGSKEKFTRHFGNRLSSEWTSPGYLERGKSMLRKDDLENTTLINSSFQELVDKYGEENARYVWETLHPGIDNDRYIYIEIEEFSHLDYFDKIKEKAKEENKELEKIPGNIRIIRNLISGKWNDDDFLIVQPGKEIKAKYDLDLIIFTD